MSFASASASGQPTHERPASNAIPGIPASPKRPEGEANARLAALHSALRVRICSAHHCNTWVSTDLSTLALNGPLPNTEDVIRGSKAFRRLSPDFFLWLEKRFVGFQRKMKLAGKENDETAFFAARFDSIRESAHANYTPEVFAAARMRLSHVTLESPNQVTDLPTRISNFDFPASGEFPCRKQVTFHALGEVDAIRDEALNLGWTDTQLYGTRGRFTFPCGPGYGVVCFIHRDQRIGQVAARHIEIVCSGGHSLHFYRKEVNQ